VAVALGLGLLLGVPYALTAASNSAFSVIADQSFDNQTVKANATSDDYALAGSTKTLVDLNRHLRRLSANSSEARGRTKGLHLIIADFPEGTPPAGQTAPASRVKGVTLDLAAIDTSAALIVARQPVVWTIANTSTAQRAKLAFDGPTAFWLENAHVGLLAGYRISTFGADTVIDPTALVGTWSQEGEADFCEALESWSKFFGVGVDEIRIWHVRNATRIALTDRDVSGGAAERVRGQWCVSKAN
jgi:hypothetical protein